MINLTSFGGGDGTHLTTEQLIKLKEFYKFRPNLNVEPLYSCEISALSHLSLYNTDPLRKCRILVHSKRLPHGQSGYEERVLLASWDSRNWHLVSQFAVIEEQVKLTDLYQLIGLDRRRKAA